MNKITIFLLLACAKFVGAQKTETWYDYNWKECAPEQARFFSEVKKTDSGYLRYDYFVQERSLQMSGIYEDQGCTIQNGYFRFFHPNKIIQSSGIYEHGKKEGLWLSYHPNQMMEDSTIYLHGQPVGTSLSWHSNGYPSDSTVIANDGHGVNVKWFDNGALSSAGLLINFNQPDGKWKFYHKNGQPSAVEIYARGVLLNKTYFDEKGHQQTDTSNNDRSASFRGGTQAWLDFIQKRLYFPEQYQLLHISEAVVIVDFTVNENGKVEDINTSTPFYPAFDRIAEAAIAKSPDWIPARNHNRNVKTKLRQKVVFSQPD